MCPTSTLAPAHMQVRTRPAPAADTLVLQAWRREHRGDELQICRDMKGNEHTHGGGIPWMCGHGGLMRPCSAFSVDAQFEPPAGGVLCWTGQLVARTSTAHTSL